MNRRTIVALCVLVSAAGAFVSAQGGTVRFVPPQPRMIRLLEPLMPQGRSGDTKVIGTVIDIRQSPVAGAHLQLRDLNAGHVLQEGVSGNAGEYEFRVADAGVYVVEMVGGVGQVVALSNAGTVPRFQTLNTVIQLPGRWDVYRNMLMVPPPSVTSFVGMSAQTSMTAATLQAAVGADITPADPGEPVSP